MLVFICLFSKIISIIQKKDIPPQDTLFCFIAYWNIFFDIPRLRIPI